MRTIRAPAIRPRESAPADNARSKTARFPGESGTTATSIGRGREPFGREDRPAWPLGEEILRPGLREHVVQERLSAGGLRRIRPHEQDRARAPPGHGAGDDRTAPRFEPEREGVRRVRAAEPRADPPDGREHLIEGGRRDGQHRHPRRGQGATPHRVRSRRRRWRARDRDGARRSAPRSRRFRRLAESRVASGGKVREIGDTHETVSRADREDDLRQIRSERDDATRGRSGEAGPDSRAHPKRRERATGAERTRRRRRASMRVAASAASAARRVQDSVSPELRLLRGRSERRDACTRRRTSAGRPSARSGARRGDPSPSRAPPGCRPSRSLISRFVTESVFS